MKTVTLTELRRNLETYLDEAKNGDVVVTRYGKVVARLISVETNSETQSSESNSSESSADLSTRVSTAAA